MRKFRVYFYRYLSILLTFTLLFSSLITPVQVVWGDRTDNLAGFINDVQSLENIEISGEWNNEEDMNKQVQGKGLAQNNLGLISSLFSSTENNQIVANSVYEREDTEILVKFNNVDEADRIKKDLKSKLKLSKLNLKKRIKSSNLDVLEIGATDNIKNILKALEKESSVEYAQPNFKVTFNYMPTDPQFSSQWSLLNNGQEVNGQAGMPGVDIDVVNAWDRTSGNRDIIVGVLDTGIDISHSDLYDNIYVNDDEIEGNGIDDDNNGYTDDTNGWNFYSNNNTVYSSRAEDFHGTQVAGIIAAGADNGGIVGVAPNVRILPLKFISGGYGYTSDAIEAIEYAKGFGVELINCSWGGSDPNPALKDAMENSGMFFSCAAGNSGNDLSLSPIYPACFGLENIISVAAIDNQGNLANFSNYGSQADIAAPGVNILSTYPGNGYALFNGTSAAAPFVTGVAALLSSMDGSVTTDGIKTRMKQGIKPLASLVGKVNSLGMLDANNIIGGGLATDVNTVTDANDSTVSESVYAPDDASMEYLLASTISTDTTLTTTEAVYGNLCLSGGTLDLNGQSLYVYGSVVQYNGVMKVNNGTLNITGDYKILSSNGSYCPGILQMTGESDRVIVDGSFITDSTKDHSTYLTAGIMEVKGNFTQRSYSSEVGASSNFSASGSHKVVLSGTGLQTISFDDPTTSSFNILQVTNTGQGLSCSGYMPIRNLNSNFTVQGNLKIASDMDLAGNIITVNGTVYQYNGILKINNGTLNITGDYKIQSSIGGDCPGILQMTGTSDKVIVGGSFYTDSRKDHSTYLTAGTLEVKGNFTQRSLSTETGASSNFNANSDHKVVLTGTGTQILAFDDPAVSGFNILEASGIGQVINCSKAISIRKLAGKLTVQGNLLIGGNTDLQGNILTVNGSLIQYDGILNINTGTLNISGDYKIQSSTGSSSPGILQMTNASDRVVINGNFYTDSTKDHSQYLTAGVLEVRGNFTQRSYQNVESANSNFNSGGTHKVLLSGTNLQTIDFLDPSISGFGTLEITNTEQGISCATGISIHNLQNDLYVKGNLKLGGNSDLAGHTIIINGSLTQYDGILNINNGTLYVTGDYKIQSSSGIQCPGALKMTGAADKVVVEGNFLTYSNKNHSTYLTDGTLEVRGNFDQKSYYTTNDSINNFCTSGAHRVLLSGTSVQAVNFEDYGTSKFNTLILTKPIDTGYTFNYQPVWVSAMALEDDIEAPTAPTNLRITSKTSSSISLSWGSAIDNTIIDKYVVLRNGMAIGETIGNSFIDTNFTQGSTYLYTIKAYDTKNNISASSSFIVITTDKEHVVENNIWYKITLEGKIIYILEPNSDDLYIEARVCDVGSSTAMLYNFVDGQWNNTYLTAAIPEDIGVITTIMSTESSTRLLSLDNIIVDITDKVDEIKEKITDSVAFDPDYMTADDWKMVYLGINAGIIETTFPSATIFNPKTLIFNKDNAKALLYKIAELSESQADSNYYYINAKVATEYCIMITATIIETGLLATAISELEQAGISFTGGFAVLAGSGGTAAPIALSIEVDSTVSLVTSGVCALASVSAGDVANNAKYSLDNDKIKCANVNSNVYSGTLEKVNKPDAAADALAQRIGGESRVKFSNDPSGREFDVINDSYIAQTKPALSTINQSVRNQMKATFEAAKTTGRNVYYHFEGTPSQIIIDKLNEYSVRYGVDIVIDTIPLF